MCRSPEKNVRPQPTEVPQPHTSEGCVFFPPFFFPPSVVLLDFFIAFLGVSQQAD
jgi:hypothetical protein